ncbi:MAG: hypothetical protein LBR16_01325 [Treponema sp.]|jgi:hypothetical protein|nr:hypothetical protein [Treponema sp.]
MKKLLCVCACVCALGAVSLWAQDDSIVGQKYDNEAEIYYKNVMVDKIYTYRKGYVVQYRTKPGRISRAYIPNDWFRQKPPKAEMVTLKRAAGPSLMVFYKDGAFQSCRLYVLENRKDPTWGIVPFTQNLDSEFDNAADLKLEF